MLLQPVWLVQQFLFCSIGGITHLSLGNRIVCWVMDHGTGNAMMEMFCQTLTDGPCIPGIPGIPLSPPRPRGPGKPAGPWSPGLPGSPVGPLDP